MSHRPYLVRRGGALVRTRFIYNPILTEISRLKTVVTSTATANIVELICKLWAYKRLSEIK